jgi:hypothetical protein
VQTITASAALTESGQLALSYRLTGDPLGIRLPASAFAAQADGLWQHTCCEAFIAAVDCPEYREFNFSPSGQWAAYRFTDYRQRDSSFIPDGVPPINFRRLDDGFELDALLDPELLPAGDTLQLGLSVVLEAANGDKSFWALAHCSPQPDFHLRQSFTLTLNIKPT